MIDGCCTLVNTGVEDESGCTSGAETSGGACCCTGTKAGGVCTTSAGPAVCCGAGATRNCGCACCAACCEDAEDSRAAVEGAGDESTVGASKTWPCCTGAGALETTSWTCGVAPFGSCDTADCLLRSVSLFAYGF